MNELFQQLMQRAHQGHDLSTPQGIHARLSQRDEQGNPIPTTPQEESAIHQAMLANPKIGVLLGNHNKASKAIEALRMLSQGNGHKQQVQALNQEADVMGAHAKHIGAQRRLEQAVNPPQPQQDMGLDQSKGAM